MILQLNPKEFISEFINPINELNREGGGKIAVFCDGKEIYSVTTTKAKTITLYNTFQPINVEDPIERCSINSLKLIKGLQCVGADEMFVSLEIAEKDKCSFSTKDIRFNIRLLDDNLITVPNFKVEVFKQFPIHHSIEIKADKVSNIKKALEFSTDVCKFYLEQEDTDLYFYFGDKNSTSNHTDDIKILVAEDLKSQVPNKIYDLEILRLILKLKNDFSMKLNDNGVMFIEIENNKSNLKYITSPLKK